MLARIIAETIFPFAILFRKIDLWMLGIEVKINKIGPGWMQGVAIHTMDLFWRPIRTTGLNCWTIGQVDKNGKSTRFNEKSKYFQAWLGCYIVKSNNHFGIEKGTLVRENGVSFHSFTKTNDASFSKGKRMSEKTNEIKIIDYNKLGIADQNTWLKLYMSPKAQTKMDYKTVKFIKKFKIASGHTCHLFLGEYITVSDNSNKTKTFRVNLTSRLNYKLFKGKKDFFNHTAFIPKYDDKTPFKPIRLKGYFGIVPFFDKNKHVVFYGCGTKKNFDKIKNEILSMIESSEIKTRF